MNKDGLMEYADQICKHAEESGLGGFCVFVGKEGVVSSYTIPKWGILEMDEGKETMTLRGLRDQSLDKWIEDLDLSSYFLEALQQSCKKAVELTGDIQKELENVIEGAMKAVESAKNSNSQSLH